VAKVIELRQRIKTVEIIKTVTRILATVSAAKLSRTRHRAAGMRDYTQNIRAILYDQQVYMASTGLSFGAFSSLLKETEPVKNIALLVITADRGMCGGYNLAVCRLALDFWERRGKADQKVKFIIKGKKGAAYFKKHNAEIIHKENWRRKGVKAEDVERLLKFLLTLYLSGEADEVYAVYTQFYSPVHRRPQVVRMLPVGLHLKEERPAEKIERWYYEPSFRETIGELLAIYLRVQLFDVLLESYASEQGARMITMEEAAERADKTLLECRVQYNRLRREVITTELLGVLFASKVTEETGVTPGRLT
jgi:F-type H+-transporting ATPase subunit gamma